MNKSEYCPVCRGHKVCEIRTSNETKHVSVFAGKALALQSEVSIIEVFCGDCGLKFHVDSI